MHAAPDPAAPLRGVSVGTLSAATTASAHTLGGAMFPSQAALVMLCVVSAALGFAAASMPAATSSRSSLVVTLVAAQSIGHILLTLVDGHHHGPLLDAPMLTAHVLAVVIGACAIRGAERGIARAASSIRRVLTVLAGLVVDESVIPPPLPVYREPAARWLRDLSGSGNRGPPALSF